MEGDPESEPGFKVGESVEDFRGSGMGIVESIVWFRVLEYGGGGGEGLEVFMGRRVEEEVGVVGFGGEVGGGFRGGGGGQRGERFID